MSCSACFNDFLIKCPESVKVNAPLTPSSTYRWNITDKFNHVYEGEFTTDEDGLWEIPVEDLPDGLLTEYSGEFKLTVLDNSCSPVRLKLAQEYDSIHFHVKGGTAVKDNLGCPVD